MKKIAILGSTGSIGTQTVDILPSIEAEVVALTTNRRIGLLEEQARALHPKMVCAFDENAAKELRVKLADTDIEVLTGMDGLIACASESGADIVVTAVVGMVGLLPTLAAINADYSGNGSSSAGSTDGTTTPSAQVAGNVIYDNFYNWRRNYQNGEYCTVYDFSTGYSWKLRIMTKDAHMDADTAIMLKAFGGKTTWTPKAVWVTFSDGKTYIGSTHDVPHSPQHLSNNNFNGHLCVHFPISIDKAKSIGPYATSHQEAINEGWAATQKLKY